MPIDPKGTYIFTPNHASNLDIPLFALSWPGHYRFMAKKEWADVPVFGIFFRTIDIPVDRGNKMSAYRTLVKTEEETGQRQQPCDFPRRHNEC